MIVGVEGDAAIDYATRLVSIILKQNPFLTTTIVMPQSGLGGKYHRTKDIESKSLLRELDFNNHSNRVLQATVTSQLVIAVNYFQWKRCFRARPTLRPTVTLFVGTNWHAVHQFEAFATVHNYPHSGFVLGDLDLVSFKMFGAVLPYFQHSLPITDDEQIITCCEDGDEAVV